MLQWQWLPTASIRWQGESKTMSTNINIHKHAEDNLTSSVGNLSEISMLSIKVNDTCVTFFMSIEDIAKLAVDILINTENLKNK